MLFTLEALPANEGDCLLLHWGTLAAPRLALIDGGPGFTWEQQLRPRLLSIREERLVESLILDLVMVSHVDKDHIVGIKKLFRQLKKELADGSQAGDRAFSVRRLWHNTFNDVLDDAIDSYYQTLTASLVAGVGGEVNPELEIRLTSAYTDRHGAATKEASDVAHDVALILAGHSEARELRDSHAYLRNAGQLAALNSPFEKNGKPSLITAEAMQVPVTVAGLNFRILGPRDAEIKALQADFDKYLIEKGLTVESMLAAYSDRSVPNLSSIVCLVEFGGKRILLTGDARGDKILDALAGAGLLNSTGTVHIDVLKVPHHGSDHNLDANFFSSITADTYVLSGNGRYGNPERVTIEWITASRAPDDVYTIAFTYPVATIDKRREQNAALHQEPWNSASDTLSSLIAELRRRGHRFTVAEGTHKAELGDELLAW